MKWRSRIRPLAAPLMLCIAHLVLLYVLDATRVVGHLLGAVRPSIAPVLLLAMFFVLRLFVMFVVPGWLVLAVVHVIRNRPDPNDTDRRE